MKVSKDIVELFHRAGPWCTVHVDVSTGTVDSLKAMDVLADHIQTALAAAGASKEDVALAASLAWRAEGVPAPCSRYVLIRSGQVEVNQVLRGSPPEQLIGAGSIPNLVPLLSSTNGDFNYVVVEAERAHAEVRLYRVNTMDPLQRKEVQGDTENLRKVPGGGLSQGTTSTGPRKSGGETLTRRRRQWTRPLPSTALSWCSFPVMCEPANFSSGSWGRRPVPWSAPLT